MVKWRGLKGKVDSGRPDQNSLFRFFFFLFVFFPFFHCVFGVLQLLRVSHLEMRLLVGLAGFALAGVAAATETFTKFELKNFATSALNNLNSRYDLTNEVPWSPLEIGQSTTTDRVEYHDPVARIDVRVTRLTLGFTALGYAESAVENAVAVIDIRGYDNARPGLELVSLSLGHSSNPQPPSPHYSLEVSTPDADNGYRRLCAAVVAETNKPLPAAANLQLQKVFGIGIMSNHGDGANQVWALTVRTSLGPDSGVAFWKFKVTVRVPGNPTPESDFQIVSIDSTSVYVLNADPILAYNAQDNGPKSPVADVPRAQLWQVRALAQTSINEACKAGRLSCVNPLTVTTLESAKQQDTLEFRIAFKFEIVATTYTIVANVEGDTGRYGSVQIVIVYRQPFNKGPELSVSSIAYVVQPTRWNGRFDQDKPGFPARDMAEAAMALYNRGSPQIPISRIVKLDEASQPGNAFWGVTMYCDTPVEENVLFKIMLGTSGMISLQTGRTGSLTAENIISLSAASTQGSAINIPPIVHDIKPPK
jgi:hypothetical protein